MHYFSGIAEEQNYEYAKEIKRYTDKMRKENFKLLKNINYINHLKNLRRSFSGFLYYFNNQLSEIDIDNIFKFFLFHFTLYKKELYCFSFEGDIIKKVDSDSDFISYINKIAYIHPVNNDYILFNFKPLLIEILENKINMLKLFQPNILMADTNKYKCIHTNRKEIKDLQGFDIL